MKTTLALCTLALCTSLAWADPGSDGMAQRIDPHARRGAASDGGGDDEGAGVRDDVDARRAVAERDLARLQRVADRHLRIHDGLPGPSGGGFPDALARFHELLVQTERALGAERPDWDRIEQALEQGWEQSDGLIAFRRDWEAQYRASGELDYVVRGLARQHLIPALRASQPTGTARGNADYRALGESLDRLHTLLDEQRGQLERGKTNRTGRAHEISELVSRATGSAIALSAPPELGAEDGYQAAGGVARSVIARVLQPAQELVRSTNEPGSIVTEAGREHARALQARITTLKDELESLDQALRGGADMRAIQARVDGVLDAALAIQRLRANERCTPGMAAGS